ncbi:MAG TPA: universal stress protein [Verrucomicrobiae bacterium]|nr:universal stress protein [Verrucomicrobiae bacterium]
MPAVEISRHLTVPTSTEAFTVFRRILVPMDFSQASDAALQCAVTLALQSSATLTLLHVIDVSTQVSSGDAHSFMQQLWQDGATRIAQLARSLTGRVEAHTKLAEGLPWEAIVRSSAEFDLLVLGEKRNHKHNLFSTHTFRRVVEHACCPVLVVHESEVKPELSFSRDF